MEIVNTKFELRFPKSDSPTAINLRVYHYGNRYAWSTRKKIHPDDWSVESQRPKHIQGNKEKNDNYKDISMRLGEIESAVKDFFRDNERARKIPTPTEFTGFLNKEFYPQRSGSIDFVQFIEEMIDDRKSGKKLAPSSKIYSPNTIKKYKSTLFHLSDYQRISRRSLNFEDINLDFYHAFIKYMNDKSLALNTIGTNIQNIKVFMREAIAQGLTENTASLNKDFKVPKEKTSQLYLNEEQLNKLYILDLSSRPSLERVRDLFIVGCYTGFRFADLSRLSGVDIIGDSEYIKLRTQKTGEEVVIPIKPIVKEILYKYHGSFPPAPQNQPMNRCLKEIGKLAGLDNDYKASITKGGETQEVVLPIYQHITTHTARRSFATNMYLAGIPSDKIKNFTGHKTEKSYLRYIRSSPEQAARMYQDHPFFKK